MVQMIRGDGSFNVKVFADSDWACNMTHRRSITSVYVYWNGVLARATSNIQCTCALSSGEAEFSALVRATSTAHGVMPRART